jgi:hypothetical protein
MGVPIKGDLLNRAGAFFGNLKVIPMSTPSMKVKVTEGAFWHNGTTFVEYAGGVSPTITVSSSNARWCAVVIDKSANILIISGTESANPKIPSIPEGLLALALVYVDTGVAAIYDDMIFDARPFLGASVFASQHNGMTNRTDQDCHPIDAITNLRSELDLRPSQSVFDSDLANKADITGTPNTAFLLNQDLTGTAASDCKIEVERGSEPNVNIMWKEDTEQWQITNDLVIRSVDPANELKGLVLISPDGSRFKVTVDDTGVLSTTKLI